MNFVRMEKLGITEQGFYGVLTRNRYTCIRNSYTLYVYDFGGGGKLWVIDGAFEIFQNCLKIVETY